MWKTVIAKTVIAKIIAAKTVIEKTVTAETVVQQTVIQKTVYKIVMSINEIFMKKYVCFKYENFCYDANFMHVSFKYCKHRMPLRNDC